MKQYDEVGEGAFYSATHAVYLIVAQGQDEPPSENRSLVNYLLIGNWTSIENAALSQMLAGEWANGLTTLGYTEAVLDAHFGALGQREHSARQALAELQAKGAPPWATGRTSDCLRFMQDCAELLRAAGLLDLTPTPAMRRAAVAAIERIQAERGDTDG